MGKRSRGELKIEDILMDVGFKYEIEYIFPDLRAPNGKPLRFDFAVFDDDGEIDFLIEYQGEQHYTAVKHFGGQSGLHRQRHNDSLKVNYCLRHDYPLVAIPYWDYDKITYDYIFNEVERFKII